MYIAAGRSVECHRRKRHTNPYEHLARDERKRRIDWRTVGSGISLRYTNYRWNEWEKEGMNGDCSVFTGSRIWRHLRQLRHSLLAALNDAPLCGGQWPVEWTSLAGHFNMSDISAIWFQNQEEIASVVGGLFGVVAGLGWTSRLLLIVHNDVTLDRGSHQRVCDI